jgi:anti-anti-sigma factor
MSLHVLSHPWEVREVEDGTLVTITRKDLDAATASVLAGELFDLARESGAPTLYLDLGQVSCLPSVVCGKLFALNRKLHEAGGRLVLLNLSPAVQEMMQAEKRPDGPTPA